MSEILTAKDIAFSLQGRLLFSGLNFSIREGESLVLRGPNGCGKSSLLRGLVGLRPLRGQVGWKISRSEIGYLPQLELGESLPWTNVQDFVESAVTWSLWRGPFSPSSEKTKTEALFTEWNLYHLKDLTLHQLSKGQLQKIAWLRTFRVPKKVYLLDEPLTFMDQEFKEKCVRHLIHLKSQGVSFISVFHDVDIPSSLEDQTLRFPEWK